MSRPWCSCGWRTDQFRQYSLRLASVWCDNNLGRWCHTWIRNPLGWFCGWPGYCILRDMRNRCFFMELLGYLPVPSSSVFFEQILVGWVCSLRKGSKSAAQTGEQPIWPSHKQFLGYNWAPVLNIYILQRESSYHNKPAVLHISRRNAGPQGSE